MTPAFAPPPPPSSAPRRPLPPGACDSHAHVFGPPEAFALRDGSAYAPPLAPFEAYLAMHHAVGVARGILVQPAAYGLDHRAVLTACKRSKGAVRGIGLAEPQVSDADLGLLRQGGIIGLRFVEMSNPAGGGRYPGSLGIDDLIRLAPRMRAMGFQAHLWCGLDLLVERATALIALGVPLVLDHMGGFRAPADLSQPLVQRFLGHVRNGDWWVKLSLCRASANFPDYPDLRAVHDALVEANPKRLLWGSDWPHIRLGPATPDVGHLLDLFDDWIGQDGALREMILVENPKSLFGFADIAEAT